MILMGRRKIFTDEAEITSENIISVLKKAYSIHQQNAREIQFLMDYERGTQPLQREKKIRQDINVVVTDNMANYIKKFHVGYFWSSPVLLVQRGNKEIHDTDKDADSSGIAALNEMLQNASDMGYKDQMLGEFVEICGIGHRFVDIKTSSDFDQDVISWNDDKYVGSLVNVDTLDSRYAFCVYHNGVGQKKLLGVTFAKAGSKLKFTCFTDKERFEIVGWEIEDVKDNLLGKNPVIEFERSFDRMGCFERSISEMDSLNVMISDFTNDVAQRTQEIWWGDNINFPKDENTGKDVTPQTGQWLLTYSDSASGKVAKIQPMSSTVDNTSTLSAIDKQRNWILQKNNVPIQYDSSGGGSTGVAMDISAGWSDTEVAAMQKQQITERARREELGLILRAIKMVPSNVLPSDSPIRNVHVSDIDYKYSRKKNHDLSTKSNCFATLVSHGIDGRHALIVSDLFADVEQTWIDSKDGIEAYQRSVYDSGTTSENTSDRAASDLSDQVENSPILGAPSDPA